MSTDIAAAAAQGAAAGAAGGPWGMAAGAAIAIGSSLLAGGNKRKIAAAQAQAAKELAIAGNRQRAAKNKASAAAADLQRTVQGINNERMARVGASNEAAARSQLNALQEADTARTFDSRVQAAERAGGLAAASALAGVAGGSYDAIQGTLALQQARIEERASRAAAGRDFNASVGIANQASNVVAGMDISAILPTLDRTINSTNQGVMTPGSVWSDLAAGMNKVGTQNLGAAAEAVWGGVKQKLNEWNWSGAASGNDAGYALPLQYQEKDV